MSKRLAVGSATIVLAFLAAGITGSAQAQHSGSAEDQLACTPDVYRLCGSYVPDEDAIVACLRRSIRSLSPACRQVMTRPDNAPAPGGDNQDTD